MRGITEPYARSHNIPMQQAYPQHPPAFSKGLPELSETYSSTTPRQPLVTGQNETTLNERAKN